MKALYNLTSTGRDVIDSLLSMKTAKVTKERQGKRLEVPFISHGMAWRLFYGAKKAGARVDVDERQTIVIQCGTWSDNNEPFYIALAVKRRGYQHDVKKPLRHLEPFTLSR